MAKDKDTDWEILIQKPLDRLSVDDDGFVKIYTDNEKTLHLVQNHFELKRRTGQRYKFPRDTFLWTKIPTESDTTPCRLLPEDDVPALLELWPNTTFEFFNNGTRLVARQESYWRCPFDYSETLLEGIRDATLSISAKQKGRSLGASDDKAQREKLDQKLAGLSREERSSPSFYPVLRETFEKACFWATVIFKPDWSPCQFWAFRGKLIKVENAGRLRQDEVSTLVGHAVLEEDRAFQDMKDEIAQFNRNEARKKK